MTPFRSQVAISCAALSLTHLRASRVTLSASLSAARATPALPLLPARDDESLEERVEALGRLQRYHEEVPPARAPPRSSAALLCWRVSAKRHSQARATLVGQKRGCGERLALTRWLSREALSHHQLQEPCGRAAQSLTLRALTSNHAKRQGKWASLDCLALLARLRSCAWRAVILLSKRWLRRNKRGSRARSRA